MEINKILPYKLNVRNIITSFQTKKSPKNYWLHILSIQYIFYEQFSKYN